MKEHSRIYLRDFIGAMAAYMFLLIGSLVFIPLLQESPWRFAVAVLPVIPLLFALAAYLRFLNHMDELQQRIQLNALALAAGVVGMVSFTAGLLENVGIPQLSLTLIFPLMIACWGIASMYFTWGYR